MTVTFCGLHNVTLSATDFLMVWWLWVHASIHQDWACSSWYIQSWQILKYIGTCVTVRFVETMSHPQDLFGYTERCGQAKRSKIKFGPNYVCMAPTKLALRSDWTSLGSWILLNMEASSDQSYVYCLFDSHTSKRMDLSATVNFHHLLWYMIHFNPMD